MIPPRQNVNKSQDRLKDVLDIGAVLYYYGADRVPNGSGWNKMRCIHGERNPSATINLDEGAFNCFSCGLKGDAIAIIRKMDDCSFIAACNKYEEITGQKVPGLNQPRSSERVTAVDNSKSYESGGYLASRLRK